MKWNEDPLMKKMIFSLGMVELVSYWKNHLFTTGSDRSRRFKQRSDPLVEKICIFNGLGEFFYVNKITEADPEGFMEMVCALGEEVEEPHDYAKKQDTTGSEKRRN